MKIIYSLLCLCIISFSYNALARVSSEQIIASATYKMIQYVSWKNEDNDTTKTMCTIGLDPVAELIRRYKRDKINIISEPTADELNSCDFVYISVFEESNLKSIFESTTNYPIVTISNIKGFARDGGIIELGIVNNRIKLVINIAAALKNNIVINSDLLTISEVIQ